MFGSKPLFARWRMVCLSLGFLLLSSVASAQTAPLDDVGGDVPDPEVPPLKELPPLVTRKEADAPVSSDGTSTPRRSARPRRVQRATAVLEIRYEIGREAKWWNFRGAELRARGITVAAYRRKIFGVPIIEARGTTDARGRVALDFETDRDRGVRFRIETDSPVARTRSGAWNAILKRPHRRTLSLSATEARGKLRKAVTCSGRFGRAVMIQDVATRTGRFVRRELAGIQPRFRKLHLVFPGRLAASSHCFSRKKVVIKDHLGDNHPEAVMHEIGHALWYEARGGVELHWPLRHRMSVRAGNRALAMSEGFANWFGAWMGNAFCRAQGHPELADDTFRWNAGESRRDYGLTKQDWASWDDDSEQNILCALWDLTDKKPDGFGVIEGFWDQTNGRGHPAGREGFRTMFRAVNDLRDEKEITFRTLWDRRLKAVYGRAGAASVTMNGIRVE